MKADEVPEGGLIHFAAAVLRFGTVIRQRCSWCGALIDEVDVANVAMPTAQLAPGETVESHFVYKDGTPKQRWSGLVWVSEGFPTVKWALDDSGDEAPGQSCMCLDLEVTR